MALLPTSLVRLPHSAQGRVNPGTLASDRELIDVLQPVFCQLEDPPPLVLPIKVGEV